MTRLGSAEVDDFKYKVKEWNGIFVFSTLPRQTFHARIMRLIWLSATVMSATQLQLLYKLSASASPILPAPLMTIRNIVPALDDFISAERDMFLHVQCSDSQTTDLTNHVCGYLRNAGVNVICYQFDTNDVRFATVDAMLRTLLSLMCNQLLGTKYGDLGIATLQYLQATQACSTPYLLDYLKSVMAFYRRQYRNIVYVLGGLDRSDSGIKQFISHLALNMHRRDYYPRFIITTAGKTNGVFAESKFVSKLYNQPFLGLLHFINHCLIVSYPQRHRMNHDNNGANLKSSRGRIHKLHARYSGGQDRHRRQSLPMAPNYQTRRSPGTCVNLVYNDRKISARQTNVASTTPLVTVGPSNSKCC
jgi:hypothetical protein